MYVNETRKASWLNSNERQHDGQYIHKTELISDQSFNQQQISMYPQQLANG